MKSRGRWQGMLTVARFNWPMYLAATFVFIASVVGIFFIENFVMRAALWIVAFGCFYLTVISLAVSHWIYDRSDLYRWKWLKSALPSSTSQQIVFCHSGFDESSALLAEEFPGASWLILDHHDAERMSEPSIKLARKLFPPVAGTIAAPFDQWPGGHGKADRIFGILAIHELRETEERSAWFREAGRFIKEDGRIVIVEHVRNVANFLAFGPGFLHFHSRAAWQESWEAAGMLLDKELKITPFLRVFVLKK